MYWSLLYLIAEKLRPGGVAYSAEQFHTYYKSRFLGCDDIPMPNGKTLTIPRSTASLDVAAGLHCMLCYHVTGQKRYGVHVHHIREGQGAAQRADDMLTVSLCPDHHLGRDGVHGLGRKGLYTRYKITELDLLAMTLEALEP